jgi:DNA-directed RNA polymerase specialized sigma24 family protein
MSTLNRRIARDVFQAHVGLVYAIARKWCPKILARLGKHIPPDEIQETIQDAVCRALNAMLQRCDRQLPKLPERKAWVAQCAMSGVKNACKTARRFGNPAPQAGYVDAMARRGSPEIGAFRHGLDAERQSVLEQVHYVPVEYGVQRWEVEELLQRERLPEHLHKTALYAAMGLTQADSALLQGVTDRTIRNRLQEIRQYLNPSSPNVYSVVVEALRMA